MRIAIYIHLLIILPTIINIKLKNFVINYKALGMKTEYFMNFNIENRFIFLQVDFGN